MATHVLMNPPFNAAQHNPSPDPARRLAHMASGETLDRWVATAARLLDAAGTLTLIWRADGARWRAGRARRWFRRGVGAAGLSQARRAGDPHPGARRQREPRAACDPAGAYACRRRGQRRRRRPKSSCAAATPSNVGQRLGRKLKRSGGHRTGPRSAILCPAASRPSAAIGQTELGQWDEPTMTAISANRT